MNNERLIAYLTGTLHEKERKEVETWYLASEDNQQLLEQTYFTLFVGHCAHAYNQIDVNKSFLELKERIRRNRRKTAPVRRFLKYGWRVAVASAAVLAGIVVLNGLRIMESTSRPLTIVTNLGERAQTILPDGSKVWIGACSRVAYYPPSFFTKERRVFLTGEAYFEVAKNEQQPFIVNSNNKLHVTVIGTKFNIRSNEDDRYITATLLEGALRITAPEWNGKEIIMNSQEQLRFNQETSQSTWYACPTADECIGWVYGKLHFEQAPLNEIVTCLERYYNIDITIIGEKLQHEKFTCDFETTENIYQIISILKMTNKFNCTIQNRQVKIAEIAQPQAEKNK
jgi:ferric-dicitrate binding protein FerR (iron transport regulator)